LSDDFEFAPAKNFVEKKSHRLLLREAVPRAGQRVHPLPRRPKAPEDWRTPRRSAFAERLVPRASVLDCGGPPPLFSCYAKRANRQIAVASRRQGVATGQKAVANRQIPVAGRKSASQPGGKASQVVGTPSQLAGRPSQVGKHPSQPEIRRRRPENGRHKMGFPLF
jgi:hypothetical protein